MKNTQIGAIHPLVAGAAASVMLVSLVGAAAITGLIPTSHGANEPVATAAPLTAAPAASAVSVAPAPAPQVAALAAQPPVASKTVVHHRYVTHVQHVQVAQAAPLKPQAYSQPAPPQAQQAQYHPVGIGVGAVVGGLLGNQVGGGNGRTLATIAGALGGGYVGNEVAKRQAQ